MRTTWFFICLINLFALSAGDASVNSYSGSVGGNETVFELAWHDNGSVTGQCALADGGVWQLQGSNYAEGKLQLSAFQQGRQIGVLQLAKSSLGGVIAWVGDLLLADNSRYPVSFSRASARSASAPQTVLPTASRSPVQSIPDGNRQAIRGVLSFQQAKAAADQGDAFAQAVVALHYQLGWNTEKNPELAAKYASASANAGEPLGQFRLGALMREGIGAPKDEQRGLSLQAASFNGLYSAQDPYSMTAAGIMIFQGKIVGQNISQDERRLDAAALYKKAADMGYAPAQFNYAMALNDGHGVPRDEQSRDRYVQEAASRDYPLAVQWRLENPITASGTLSSTHTTARESPESIAQNKIASETSPDQGLQPISSDKGAIFTVVQEAPRRPSAVDITFDEKTAAFSLLDKLALYEVRSGRLIKSLPPIPSYYTKIFFRFGESGSLLVCDNNNHSVSEIHLSDGNTKTVFKNVQGTVVGYDSRRDDLLIADGTAVLRLSLQSGKRSKVAHVAENSVNHAFVNSSGDVGLLGMGLVSGEEPCPWVNAFSRSVDNFEGIYTGANAVAQILKFFGVSPSATKTTHKQVGWEGIQDWTDIQIAGQRIWLDHSVDTLAKPGWLLGDSCLVRCGERPTSYAIPSSTTLHAEGVAASESGDSLLWWHLDRNFILSLAQSGDTERSEMKEGDYSPPTIFRPAEVMLQPVPLEECAIRNAALDARGHNAFFITTDINNPKGATLVKNVNRYSSETWQFTTQCITLDVESGSIRTNSTTAAIWPLDNEYTEGSTWYFDFGYPFAHTEIRIDKNRYSSSRAAWEITPQEVRLARNPLSLSDATSGGDVYDAESQISALWTNALNVEFSNDHTLPTEKRSANIMWNMRGQHQSSMKLEGTVHSVFPLDLSKSIVWANQSLSVVDPKTASVISFLKYGTKGVVQEPRNCIAVCPDQMIVYLLSGDDGSISSITWNSSGILREELRIYPQRNAKPAFTTPEGFYAHLGGVPPAIHFSDGQRTYPFEQFDLRLNRPDIVLERLGAPAEAVSIAKQLREKRLKRMGVTEEMLKPDFHMPELEIVGDVPATTDGNEINVAIKASDSKYPLERLKVYVNNVPVNGRDGESLRDQNTQALERRIPVKLAAGRNKVQVSVLNNAGAESLYANAEVNCTAMRPKPTLYAVAMGVSEYSNPDWNLKYAAKDARDVLERLKSKSADSYGEVKELLLTDKDVTKESLTKIKDFLQDSTIDDTVLMFVAGHGLLDSKYDYYFGTTDIDFNNPAEKGIAFEEFDDLLAGLPCLKKSLLMDTCHAGELDQDEKTLLASADASGAASLPTANGVAMRSIGTRGMNVKAIEGARGASKWYDRLQGLFVDLRRGSGSTILSSSAGAEYALESSEQQNGLFTYAVLEALDGKKDADTNKDGSVQMSELGDYVRKRVSELTNNKQTPNTRRVNLEGDFTVAKTE